MALHIMLRDRRKEEREQAAQISAVWDRKQSLAIIYNRSDQAIYNVFIFPHNTHWHIGEEQVTIEKVGLNEWQGDMGAIAPQSEEIYEVPEGVLNNTPTGVDILFVDSFGRYWSRTSRGKLAGGSGMSKAQKSLSAELRIVQSAYPKKMTSKIRDWTRASVARPKRKMPTIPEKAASHES
jgi:hypothetical protein